MITAVTVIPGTKIVPGKQLSAEIFGGKNQSHVSSSPKPDGPVCKQPVDRGKQGGATVNRKHPEGGISFQGHFPAAQPVKCGKDDFHAPAGEAAGEEIFEKG